MDIYQLIADMGFITNLRGSQLIIILLVILLLFGSKKLPELARGIGKAIREFRKTTKDVEKDFKSAMEEDETPKAEEKTANS